MSNPSARDVLALRRALPDRALFIVVLGMTFLAGIALGGATSTTLLAQRWLSTTNDLITVETPDSRATPALAEKISHLPAVTSTKIIPETELRQILAPWIGRADGSALPMPGVIELHHTATTPPTELVTTIQALAPDAAVETDAKWSDRLALLCASLRACALAIVAVVAIIAITVIGLAVRSTLQARREPVEIVHSLGAPDGYIAALVARRGLILGLTGGIVGTALSWAALLTLARLAAPLSGITTFTPDWHSALLPTPLMWALGLLPVAAGLIGWATAQFSVRLWLRRLI